MKSLRAGIGLLGIGALLGVAAGLCEGLRAIGPTGASRERATFAPWGSVTLKAIAGALVFWEINGGPDGRRREPAPSPRALVDGRIAVPAVLATGLVAPGTQQSLQAPGDVG